MPFRNDAQLDPSQVSDRRGGGGGLGTGLAVGGGGIGVLVMLALAMLFGVDPSSVINNLPGQSASSYAADSSQTLQDCQHGSDANARTDCRVVGLVNSIQAYWQGELPQLGQRYTPTKTVLYSQATQTGCGSATSSVGPFYCPEDRVVYLDLGFFDEMHTRFGASQGLLAEGYVVAHEYGHHIQDLLGALDRPGAQSTGARGGSVQTELQADCYAGVWSRHATETNYLQPFTQQDLSDALTTAAAVGDDRIQKQTQGRVNPESWTHGSSQQRQNAFNQGYQSGDPNACNAARLAS